MKASRRNFKENLLEENLPPPPSWTWDELPTPPSSPSREEEEGGDVFPFLPGSPVPAEVSHEDGDEQEQEEKEFFTGQPLKSRRLERRLLGKPGPRSECFGCVYFGEKETCVPRESINCLLKMAREAFGRIDLITLAKGMAEYYEEEIRRKVNARLDPGARPLPFWGKAQILEHLRHHHQDPLVQQVVLLAEIQELRTNMLDCCIEVSSKRDRQSGKKRKRPNKTAVDAYEKLVKLQLHVQKQDATKMSFYNGGAKLNPEVVNQGFLSMEGKKLKTIWKK